jgi:hypothetical protein
MQPCHSFYQHRAQSQRRLVILFCGLLQGVEGFYGPPGEDVVPCPAGSYCPAGATIPTACPANTQSAASASAVVDCIPFPGYFGRPGEAATLCPGGSYCPPGMQSPTQCPANTHSPAGATDRLACQVFLHSESLDSWKDLVSPYCTHTPVSHPLAPYRARLYSLRLPLAQSPTPCHHLNSNRQFSSALLTSTLRHPCLSVTHFKNTSQLLATTGHLEPSGRYAQLGAIALQGWLRRRPVPRIGPAPPALLMSPPAR